MNSPVATGMVYVHVLMHISAPTVIDILMHIYVLMHGHILMHRYGPVEIMVAEIPASPVNAFRTRGRAWPVVVRLPGWLLRTADFLLRAIGGWLRPADSRTGRFLTGCGCKGWSASSAAKAAMVKSLGHNEAGATYQHQDEERTYKFTKKGIFHDGELIE